MYIVITPDAAPFRRFRGPQLHRGDRYPGLFGRRSEIPPRTHIQIIVDSERKRTYPKKQLATRTPLIRYRAWARTDLFAMCPIRTAVSLSRMPHFSLSTTCGSSEYVSRFKRPELGKIELHPLI